MYLSFIFFILVFSLSLSLSGKLEFGEWVSATQDVRLPNPVAGDIFGGRTSARNKEKSKKQRPKERETVLFGRGGGENSTQKGEVCECVQLSGKRK